MKRFISRFLLIATVAGSSVALNAGPSQARPRLWDCVMTVHYVTDLGFDRYERFEINHLSTALRNEISSLPYVSSMTCQRDA
jgi:hypothetical protein